MTSIDSNPPHPRTWLVRLAQRAGHHKIAMWIWYVVGGLAGSVVIGLFAAHNRGALFTFLGLLLATGLGLMKLEAVHDHRLCEACIDEVPLNPGAAAVKADRQMRAAHWTVDHRSWFLTLMLGAVAFVATEFAFLPHSSPAAFAFLGADLLAMTGFVLLLRAFNTHRRLHPWCPYCKRRGGGGGLHMPSPEPAGSTGRRR